jgi:hypothetical protein
MTGRASQPELAVRPRARRHDKDAEPVGRGEVAPCARRGGRPVRQVRVTGSLRLARVLRGGPGRA